MGFPRSFNSLGILLLHCFSYISPPTMSTSFSTILTFALHKKQLFPPDRNHLSAQLPQHTQCPHSKRTDLGADKQTTHSPLDSLADDNPLVTTARHCSSTSMSRSGNVVKSSCSESESSKARTRAAKTPQVAPFLDFKLNCD